MQSSHEIWNSAFQKRWSLVATASAHLSLPQSRSNYNHALLYDRCCYVILCYANWRPSFATNAPTDFAVKLQTNDLCCEISSRGPVPLPTHSKPASPRLPVDSRSHEAQKLHSP